MTDQETTHRATVAGPFGMTPEWRAECPCGFKGAFTLSKETAQGHARFHYEWNLKMRAQLRADARVREYPYVDPSTAYFEAKNEIREEDAR